MSIEYESGYCNNCKTDKKVERKAPNHILHLLITVILGIFTAGIGAIIWIFIWVLSSIRFRGWMCSTCGSKDVKVDIEYYRITFYIIIAIIITIIYNINK